MTDEVTPPPPAPLAFIKKPGQIAIDTRELSHLASGCRKCGRPLLHCQCAAKATPAKRRRALSPENFDKQLQRKVSLLIDDAIEQAKKGKPALLRILLQISKDQAPAGEPAPEIATSAILQAQRHFEDLISNSAAGRRAAGLPDPPPEGC